MSRFYIKKAVEAKSVAEAIRLEKNGEVIEAWKDAEAPSTATAIGFDLEAGYMDKDQLRELTKQ